MYIWIKPDKLSKSWIHPNLLFMRGYSTTLKKSFSGHLNKDKLKFIGAIKTKLENKEYMLIRIDKANKNDWFFINAAK